MQEDAAHELDIKGPQAQRAARALAAVGKGFGQDRLEAFARRLHGLLSAAVFSFSPSSERAWNSGSSALILATIGRTALIIRSFGLPNTLRAIVPRPSNSFSAWVTWRALRIPALPHPGARPR